MINRWLQTGALPTILLLAAWLQTAHGHGMPVLGTSGMSSDRADIADDSTAAAWSGNAAAHSMRRNLLALPPVPARFSKPCELAGIARWRPDPSASSAQLTSAVLQP